MSGTVNIVPLASLDSFAIQNPMNKYYITHARNGDLCEIEAADFQRLKQLKKQFLFALELELSYERLLNNYIDLWQGFARSGLKCAMMLDFNDSALIDMMNDLNRLLSNFLSTCLSYKEHGEKELKRLERKKDAESIKLQKAFSDSFDRECQNTFALRLFFFLRNYALHQAAPVTNFVINNSEMEPVEGKNTFAELKIVINSKQFLEATRSEPIVKEILQHGKHLHARPLVEECMDALSRVHYDIRAAIDHSTIVWRDEQKRFLDEHGIREQRSNFLQIRHIGNDQILEQVDFVDSLSRRAHFVAKNVVPLSLAKTAIR